MAKAQQLVDASGTKSQKVTIIATPDETTKAIDLYFVSLLRKLGYDAGIKTLNSSVQYSFVQDSTNKAQISLSYWYPDYTSASNFMTTVVGCDGFHPASTSSPNLSEFCDKGIQAKTEQALKLAQTDPDGANELWSQVDKETTDAAPWVSLFVANKLDFVSKRVGNFKFNTSVIGNFLIDQAWVK
jgi:peptide/nickel transport system substrate-binding protein